MKESDLLKLIQMSFTKIGARLFRNNTAQGWAGRAQVYTQNQVVKVGPGDVVIRTGRPLRAGLCVGSSDLIGWCPVVITSEHVGQTLAVFTAIEGKTGSLKATVEQELFISAVKSAGGFAGVARSVDEAMGVANGF